MKMTTFLIRSAGAGVDVGDDVALGAGVAVGVGVGVRAVRVAPGSGAGGGTRRVHPASRPAPVSSASRKNSRRESEVRFDLFTVPICRSTDGAPIASPTR